MKQPLYNFTRTLHTIEANVVVP